MSKKLFIKKVTNVPIGTHFVTIRFENKEVLFNTIALKEECFVMDGVVHSYDEVVSVDYDF